MALKKSPKATEHPDIAAWKKATDEIKKELDKRKGEKDAKGVQAARESLCKGEKLIRTLLDDPTFPAKVVKDLEVWCEDDFLEHQIKISHTSFERFAYLALSAAVSVCIEPLLSNFQDQDTETEGGRKDSGEVRDTLGRIMAAITAIMTLIVEAHIDADSAEASSGAIGKNISPYLDRQWISLLLTLLEHAEKKGYHHHKTTAGLIDFFETLTSGDNSRRLGIWGSDQFAVDSRLGALIMDSKVSTLSLQGMRSLVFSLPYDPAKPIADQAEIRRNYFLAAVSTHPEYKEADPQARRDIRNIVMQLPTIVSRKPRLYMKIVNHLHGIDDKDRPQGFPVRSFSLNDDNMLNSAQAKKRLAAGELIVYVDQFEMRVNDFNEYGREDALTLDHSQAMFCWRDTGEKRGQFEWFRIKPGTNDRKINIEVEPNHADRFEQALRKYFPPLAWIDTALEMAKARRSAPDNDYGELVPASSQLPPVADAEEEDAEEETNPSEADERQRQGSVASHVSDSIEHTAPEPVKPNRSAVTSQKSRRSQVIAQAVEEEEEESVVPEEEEEDAEEPVEKPRRATRASKSGGTKGPTSPQPAGEVSTTKAPVKPAARSSRSAVAKVAASSAEADDKVNTFGPAEKEPSPPLKPDEPASTGRPSRVAKSRAIKKTAGVLDGEAVPLDKAMTKAAASKPTKEAAADVTQPSIIGDKEGKEGEDEVIKEKEAKKKAQAPRGKGKGKARAKESSPAPEVPQPDAPDAEQAEKGEGHGGDEDEAVDVAKVVVAVERDPAEKVVTPSIPQPASSREVPISKLNAVSRSKQRYSRGKSGDTNKKVEVSDSDTESEEDGDAISPEADVETEPVLAPIRPASKRTAAAAAAAAKASVDPPVQPTPKSKPATRGKVVLPKAKTTIAGEIKAGAAMTPAAMKANVAAASEAKEMKGKGSVKGKGKGKVVEEAVEEAVGEVVTKEPAKKGKKAPGPPNATVGAKAVTAPGRMEDLGTSDDASEVVADAPDVEMNAEEPEPPVTKKGRAPAERAGGRGAKKRAGVESVPVEDGGKAVPPEAVEEDEVMQEGVEDDQIDQPVLPIDDAPSPARRPSPVKSALRQPIPPADSAAPQDTASPVAARVDPKQPVERIRRIKNAAFAPRSVTFSDPVEPQDTDDRAFLDASNSKKPVESGPSVSVGAGLPKEPVAETSEAAAKRDAGDIPSVNPNQSPQKRRKNDNINLHDEQRVSAEVRNRPIDPPQAQRAAGQATPPASHRKRPAEIEAAGDAEVAQEEVMPLKKRKVSINEPEREGKIGWKSVSRKQKGGHASDGVEGVLAAVKQRLQKRLAMPDKIIKAVERHIAKAAVKLVNGFGIDHAEMYQATTARGAEIDLKQTALQALYQAQVDASDRHYRDARDLFKTYQRPMQGIPMILFE